MMGPEDPTETRRVGNSDPHGDVGDPEMHAEQHGSLLHPAVCPIGLEGCALAVPEKTLQGSDRGADFMG